MDFILNLTLIVGAIISILVGGFFIINTSLPGSSMDQSFFTIGVFLVILGIACEAIPVYSIHNRIKKLEDKLNS